MSSRVPRLAFGLLPARAAEFEDTRVCDLPAPVAGGAPSFLGHLQHRLSSDEALVERLQGGNADALTVLFERHSPRLFGVARRMLRNDAEAEDAVQQIFLDVFRSIHQFDQAKGNFKTWLYLFAYQRIFNCRRSLAANRFFETDSLDDSLKELFVRPERRFDYSVAEMRVLVEQVLSRLEPRQRRTIELIYYEGFTAEEVSVKTGETVRVVRHNLYRGLEKLRKAFFGDPCAGDVTSQGETR
jgi:RNA polymerase sigma-70 factor (ECF subfamily)